MGVFDKDGDSLLKCYDSTGSGLPNAYNKDGDTVFWDSNVNYDNYEINSFLTISVQNAQGFDVYNGILFQFRAGSSVQNVVNLYDLTDGTPVIVGMGITSGHGDSASFSDELYSETDEFPLLYVSADTNPALVYVNRVTVQTSELIKTLSFPIAQAGYYAAAVCDFENNIIYMVGYSERNYTNDNGGSNKTIITKWDMTSLTDNGDGTFTPLYISKIERDFVYCTQGQQYHDGLMWIASGYSNHASYIYAIDPSDGEIEHTIDLNTNVEVEGLAWINDHSFIVGFQGGTYKTVEFQQLT